MNNRDVNDSQTPRDKGEGVGASVTSVRVVTVVLWIEALVMAGLVAVLIFDLLTQRPDSLGSAIALTAIVAIGAVWVVAVARGFTRGAAWARSGALFWQLIQIAVAVGAFQGVFAQPVIGWAILVPSLIVLVLLFSKSAIAHTRRTEI